MILHKFRVGFAASALALLSVACGAEPTKTDQPEAIGSVRQAFGVASCSTATADVVDDDGYVTFTSPSAYNNSGCYNAYIVDVNNWTRVNANYIFQDWAGSRPTTQSACNKIWMSLITYQLVDGAWVQIGKVREDYGSWDSSISWCNEPYIDWNSDLFIDGNSYRFAGTARPYYGAVSTRAFFIGHDDG